MAKTYIAKGMEILVAFGSAMRNFYERLETVDEIWLSCGGAINEVNEDALIAEANAKFEAAFRKEQNEEDDGALWGALWAEDAQEKKDLHNMGNGA